MKKRVVIFCCGTQLSIIIDIIEKQGKYIIGGLVDSKAEIGSTLYGYKVLGRQEDILKIIYDNSISGGIISVGDNFSRYKIHTEIDKKFNVLVGEEGFDWEWINAIHPSAIIGNNTKLGKGIVCMAGVIFSPNCDIGDFCAFYTGAIIEHDNCIGDYASVSANSSTGGKVTIGVFSAICMGVTIFDRVTIKEGSVVGSGSLVTKDVPEGELWYGSPAKFIRKRELTDKYLK